MDEREIKERMESESEREELHARSDFGQIRSGIIIALAPFTVASCKAAYSLQWQYRGIRLMVHRIMVQSAYLYNFLLVPF